MDGDGHFVFGREGLSELEVPDRREPHGMRRETGGQIFGYLHETSPGYDRMTGKMSGEDRVRRIEPHREGRAVLSYDAI